MGSEPRGKLCSPPGATVTNLGLDRKESRKSQASDFHTRATHGFTLRIHAPASFYLGYLQQACTAVSRPFFIDEAYGEY